MNRDRDTSKDISIDTSKDIIRYVPRDKRVFIRYVLVSLRCKTEGHFDKLFDMSEGQNQGQNSSLFEKKNLRSVPESSEEQVQEQGRLSYAPCNPVTLSFTLNLGACKKRR
jgi:hypothetical protein